MSRQSLAYTYFCRFFCLLTIKIFFPPPQKKYLVPLKHHVFVITKIGGLSFLYFNRANINFSIECASGNIEYYIYMCTLISFMFSAMLMHGVPQAGLLISSLVLIPKYKRGNKCDSENYRQNAISSLMGKLFDSIILEEQQDSLFTDLLQFGSKKKASSVVCRSLLKEIIEYYNENNADC